MSENINLQAAPTEATIQASLQMPAEMEPTNEMLSAERAYSGFLDKATEWTPTIAENREVIETAGKQLIETYNLDDKTFEDSARGMLFTSIASRWSKASDDQAERLFLEDALTLLAYQHSPQLKEVYDYANKDDKEVSDEDALRVYDKYTNTEMTEELKEAINSGLLDGVKERLGINSENEDPFEIRVLSIGDDYTSAGFQAPKGGDIDWSLPYDSPERIAQSKALQELVLTINAINDWKTGLKARTKAMSDELGHPITPAGWMTQINGKTFLCLAMTTVEKMVRPESTANASFYDEQSKLGDQAFLEHEYTHTQGGKTVERGTTFGISMEELRAEEYSGNRHGYGDVKAFARDFGIITGKDLVEYVTDGVKGGEAHMSYAELANSVGLDRMLEIVMVRPTVYDEKAVNLLNKMVGLHLGGFEGVELRLLADASATGQEKAIDERLTQRAQKIIDNTNLDYIGMYYHKRRTDGIITMTDRLEQRINELTAEKLVGEN